MAFSFRFSSFCRLSVAVLIATTIVPSSFFNKNNGAGTTGIGVIFANAQLDSQSIENKWDLDFNESEAVLADGDPKRFTIIYYVDPTIVTDNTAGQVFTEDCIGLIGDNTTGLEISGGVENIVTRIDDDFDDATRGRAIFEFDLDMATLVQNENVTQNQPDQSGVMKMCSRFSLQTADGSYEVNFLENIITINFAFDGDFTVDFNIGPKEKTFDEGQQGYTVEAYLCDPRFPDTPLPTNMPVFPGGVLSVCVKPTPEAIADGLFMRSIDNFKWFRGLTEQPVVEEGLQAGNSLSILVCEPGTMFCTMQSILYAAFFQPTQEPSAFPSDYPTEFPSDSPTEIPTSSPSDSSNMKTANYTYSFPTTSSSYLVHGLCIMSDNEYSSNLNHEITSTDSGLSYREFENFTDGLTFWDDRNYWVSDTSGTADQCGGGLFLQSSKHKVSTGTEITIDLDLSKGPVTLCAFYEGSPHNRSGDWDLSNDGFTEASDTLSWCGSGGCAAMRSFCKVFSRDVYTYNFPATTSNLVHGLCVMSSSTVRTSHIAYSNQEALTYKTLDDGFTEGTPMWTETLNWGNHGNLNYDARNTTGNADHCEGGAYLRPYVCQNQNSGTEITIELDLSDGPVTLCAFQERSRDGGWILTNEGFTEASTAFRYEARDLDATMLRSFCKEIAPPSEMPSSVPNGEPSAAPSSYCDVCTDRPKVTSNIKQLIANPPANFANVPIACWDTSDVTSMNGAFQNQASFNEQISCWDVSKVTDMSSMFRSATNFNQDINAWDVSSVTRMRDMFGNADKFDQPLDNWDVGSVTEMRFMFGQAYKFNQDINDWDVSSVGTTFWMFFQASVFNQCLSSWANKTPNTVNTGTMLAYTGCPNTYANPTVGPWCQTASQGCTTSRFLAGKEENRPMLTSSMLSSSNEDEHRELQDPLTIAGADTNIDEVPPPLQRQRDLQAPLTISGAGSATLKFPTGRRRRRLTNDGRVLEDVEDTAQTEIPTVYASLVPIDDELVNLQTAGAWNSYRASSIILLFVLVSTTAAVIIVGA